MALTTRQRLGRAAAAAVLASTAVLPSGCEKVDEWLATRRDNSPAPRLSIPGDQKPHSEVASNTRFEKPNPPSRPFMAGGGLPQHPAMPTTLQASSTPPRSPFPVPGAPIGPGGIPANGPPGGRMFPGRRQPFMVPPPGAPANPSGDSSDSAAAAPVVPPRPSNFPGMPRAAGGVIHPMPRISSMRPSPRMGAPTTPSAAGEEAPAAEPAVAPEAQ